jgi:hypoxanthine phosphoribosyltransferase
MPQPDEPTSVTLYGERFDHYIGHQELERCVSALAARLNAHMAGQEAVLMPVLTGAFRFLGRLMPQLTFPYKLACVKLSSYGSGMSPAGDIAMRLAPDLPLQGETVIVVEDMVDTGATFDYLHKVLTEAGGAHWLGCALLGKPDAFQGTWWPEFVGLELPNAFVVGYGLDFAEAGRHLPALYRHAGPSQAD